MISNIQAKGDGTYVIAFDGLPYHATHAETPEVFALVQAEIAEGAPVTPYVEPPLSPAQEREVLKASRAEAVAAIQVTVNGRVFDGDEISQGRMARAILALQTQPEGTTTVWVLADNTAYAVTITELQEALTLAGAQQTAMWLLP